MILLVWHLLFFCKIIVTTRRSGIFPLWQWWSQSLNVQDGRGHSKEDPAGIISLLHWSLSLLKRSDTPCSTQGLSKEDSILDLFTFSEVSKLSIGFVHLSELKAPMSPASLLLLWFIFSEARLSNCF